MFEVGADIVEARLPALHDDAIHAFGSEGAGPALLPIHDFDPEGSR